MIKKLIAFMILATGMAAAQTTPNLGLELPNYQAPNWGVEINYNFMKLDGFLSGGYTLPAFISQGLTLTNLTPNQCVSTDANGKLVTTGGACSTLTLTTTGTSGAATLSGGVLNIPQYNPIPTGTTNQLLYYAAGGNTVTPLTLGTNLSITGGTLNATGGGGTPAGTNGNPQFNASGSFGGAANVYYSQAADTLTTIAALCASTPATYIVNQPQSFTLAANTTLPAACNIQFTGDGEWTVSGAFTLTIDGAVSGPPTQHFAGAASIVFGPNTPVDYAEWFGAKGDGTTDDAVAMQDAVNALSGSGAAGANTGTGYVQLLAKTYLVNTTINLTRGGVGIKGIGLGNGLSGTEPAGYQSALATSSASNTILNVSGNSLYSSTDNFVENLMLERSVQPTGTATGLNLTNSCRVVVDRVGIDDSIRGMYIANTASCGQGYINNVQVYHTSVSSCSSGPYYGFYVDETSGTTPSIRFNHDSVGWPSACATSYGFYATGGAVQDIAVYNFESALNGYGVYLTSTATGTLQNSDVHFTDTVLDQCGVSCIYISGMNDTAGSSVIFNGGYLNENGTGPGIDIVNSSGVMITGAAVASYYGGSTTMAEISGGSGNAINSTTFIPLQANHLGIVLSSTSGNTITGNTIRGGSATGTIGIQLIASTRNAISANTLTGTLATGVSFDSTSNDNDLYNVNQINPTSITTPYSNAGTGNQIGVGFANPMTALGDIIYGSTGGTAAALAGNTTTAQECLTQTGTGTASNPPAWASCSSAANSITVQNAGTTLGAATTLNCSTGTNCTLSSGTATITGTGGSFAYSILPAPPATSSFTNINFQAGTTFVGSGAPNSLLLQIPTTASTQFQFADYSTALPATPWFAKSFLSASQVGNLANTGDGGIDLYDGTKIEALEFGGQTTSDNDLRITQWTNVTTYLAQPYGTINGIRNNPSGGGTYLGWCDDGTNLYAEFSPDGTNWIRLYSEAVGAFIAPTSVGLGGTSSNTGNIEYVSIQGFSVSTVTSCP